MASVKASTVWINVQAGTNGVSALALGIDGSVYVTGMTNASLDGQKSNGSQDAFVTKYSANGNKLWTKLIGSSKEELPSDISISVDGFIYIVGYTNGSFGGQTLQSAQGGFIQKISPDGVSIWTKFITAQGGAQQAIAIASVNDGSVIVAGQTSAPLGGQTYLGANDIFLTKITGEGTTQWTRMLGGTGEDIVNDIKIAPDGSFYVVGHTSGTLNGQKNSGAMYDGFLTKYSSDGTSLWTKLITSTSYTDAFAVAINNNGTIYVGGRTSGSLDGKASIGSEDAFIISFQSDGTKLWTNQFGTKSTETVFSLAVNDSGEIYATGSTGGNFQDGSNVSDLSAFISKFNSTGVQLWVDQIGSSGAADWFGSSAIGSDGAVYVAGTTYGSLGGVSNNSVASLVVKYTENAIPTYSITSTGTSVNEGNTAVFTLSTTNIGTGTTVSYYLTGISAADVSSGSLSGNAVVNSSGIATVSVSLLNDSLTEGTETLTITAGGATASTVVNDTSINSNFESESNDSRSVADPATLGSVITGQLSAITDVDYYSYTVGSSGSLSITFDGPTNISYQELFVVQLYDSAGTKLSSWTTGVDATWSAGLPSAGTYYVAIAPNQSYSFGSQSGQYGLTSTFKGVIQSTYALAAASSSVNEGSTATFTLTTTNVASGTSVPYTLSGVSAADVSGGSLSGNAVVNSSGVAIISVALLNDSLTEGTETLTVSAGGASASTLIYDSSKTPGYTIYAGYTSYNEGTTVGFYLETTNVDSGTSLTYTLSGVNSSDITGGSLTGTTIVGTNGNQKSVIYISIANDNLTEGNETLTLTINGVSASTTINDTSKAAVTPSYSLVASNASVNEGSTATFTLTTTNVASGTSVPYMIAVSGGISAADVSGGVLSGNAVINSSGIATISVALLNDSLTEGNETLTVTAGGATASTVVNDTSVTPNLMDDYPNSSLTTGILNTSGTPLAGNIEVNGDADLFKVILTAGLTYTIDVISAGTSGLRDPYVRLDSPGNEGSLVDNDSGGSLNSRITYIAEYSGTYWVGVQSYPYIGTGSYLVSVKTVAPTWSITASKIQVDEGSTADFMVTTTGVATGSSISYTLSGVSSADITGGTLSGVAIVNSLGSATISILIANDSLTEGFETLTVTVQGNTASTLINDTSKTASPTYAIAALGTSVNEGNVATFTLTTTGVTPGTSIAYTISGVSSSDVTGGLSGTATVDTNGLATISVPIAADFLTEGSETLTVTAQGKSASVIVNDTSKTTLVASYALSASTNSVSEGSSAVFTLTTTNVAGGTSIAYTISGVSSADITGGALSGTAIVSSNGNATITIPIASDLTTEGAESLTVTAQGISASVLISDTSTTPVVVTPITTVTSIPYGDGKYFYGSSGSDKVTGTSFVDVVKQTSTISSNQLTKLSDGSWQVQNKITPSNSDNLVNVERVEFSDMSVALDVSGPAGQVAKILGSVFGPSYVSNTEFTGIGFAYLDGGMSYLDLCGLAAGAAGLSTPDLLVTTLLRNTTGAEPTALSKSSYLQSISNGASYASVVQQIADSSANAQSIKLTDLANTGLAYTPYVLPPTYSLSAASASVNEGSAAVFNLTTTNVAVGTEVSYTLSGVGTSDLTSGTLTGKVSVGVGGTASINVPIAADSATEGQETLTVNAQGASATMVINDTSKGNATPTYSLTPATNSVNEGVLAQVYVSTTNVAAGTSLLFSISGIGITQGDVIEGLSRFVTVDSTGKAVIDINTIADQITEGPETMYITLDTSTTSFLINDTSVELVGEPPAGP